MKEDYFDDNFDDESEDKEREQLIERFEKMVENESFDFFDNDDYAFVFDHYFYTGKLNKAQKALSMGLKQYPDSLELKLKKVHYLIYSQKHDEALKILHETDTVFFDEPEILIEQAYLYAQLRAFEESIEKYNKVLGIEKENNQFVEDVFIGLSDVYEQMGELKKALYYMKKALDLDPENEFLLSNVSDAFYDILQEDEMHEVVDYFIEFLDKNPMSSAGWCYLGLAYTEMELYEKAVEAFDYALALDDRNEEALLYEMNTYFKLDERKKANEIFVTLLQVSQFKEMVWYQLADNLYKIGDYESALLSFQKSIDENERFSLSHAGKAITYAAMEQFDIAIESLQKAIDLDTNNPEYWLLMAEYLSDAQRNDEAEVTFQYLAERFPKDHDTWLSYSNFYILNDEINHAVDIMYEGIEKQQDNISYLYRMANYYFIKEDNIQAMSYLQLAYTSNPDLLAEFFEYDDTMYNIPEVIEFLSNINNN